MTSLENFTFSQDGTPLLDDDSFAAAAHRAADILHSPIVTPDAEQFEVMRAPFGRMGDGTLYANIAWAHELSGHIAYKPLNHDTDTSARIHATKLPGAPHWTWLNFAGNISTADLAKRLDVEWPDEASLMTNSGKLSDHDFYTRSRASLMDLAPYWQTENSYRHDEMEIDAASQLHHHITTARAVRSLQNGARRLQLTATRPALDSDDPLRCRATVDPLGQVELRAYVHNSFDNRIVEMPIDDRAATLGALTILLDRLVDEKLSLD